MRKRVRLIKNLIEREAVPELKKLCLKLHGADIAELFNYLEPEERLSIFNLLDIEKASFVLHEINPVLEKELLDRLETDYISQLVEVMPVDNAADILGTMPEERAEQVLRMMEEEEAEDVEELMSYEEETAGGIMTPDYFALPGNMTANDAVDKLRTAHDIESISYIYVVDNKKHLVGVLSLRELISAPPRATLETIMNSDIVSTHTNVDQEEVARLVRKYNLRALPIVDKKNRLVGRVTVDDVIDVIDSEATEDMYRMAGTDDGEIINRSTVGVVRLRLPWLLTSLVGGMVSASIMKSFNVALSNTIALAFFIPVIMGMGGNIGIQSSTIVVRGLATGNIHLAHLWRVLLREMRNGAVMGIVCGICVGLMAKIIVGEILLGLIVAISMFFAITVAATIGTLMPLIFKSLRIDPAIAAGPFVTTANDITGLLIYFSLATLLAGYFQ